MENETKQIDIVVGNNIKKMRIASGMSQAKLASDLGVTHQQLQKYAKAKNRISAGRLAVAAKALGCDVSIFFDGSTQKVERIASRIISNICKNALTLPPAELSELLQASKKLRGERDERNIFN